VAETVRTAPPLTWEITPPEHTPGLGAMLVVFGIGAMFFLLGVMDIGWRARFLAAFLLFAGIALSALHDMVWLTTSGLFRVEVLTASGETLRYTTIDGVEQERFLAALDTVLARPYAANDDTPDNVMPPRRPNLRLAEASA
jgi:hypothetical protein